MQPTLVGGLKSVRHWLKAQVRARKTRAGAGAVGESDDRVRGFAIGLRSHSILFKVHVLFGEQFTRVLTFIGGGGGGGGGGSSGSTGVNGVNGVLRFSIAPCAVAMILWIGHPNIPSLMH